MARRSSRRPAFSRSSRSSFGSGRAAPRTSTRSASTMAMPSASRFGSSAPSSAAAHPYKGPNYAAKPVVQSSAPQSPGLFGQMASTAAGVAVGSAVGHTIGAGITGLFGGRSQEQPAQAEDRSMQTVAATGTQENSAFQNETEASPCAADAKNLARCLEDANGDYHACDYYLQMLQSCKAAAKQYTSN